MLPRYNVDNSSSPRTKSCSSNRRYYSCKNRSAIIGDMSASEKNNVKKFVVIANVQVANTICAISKANMYR